MRPPKHIALVAAIALVIPSFASRLLELMHRPVSDAALISWDILTLMALSIPAVLVGVGTYVGALWAAPPQRTARLAQVLGVLYLIIGVVLSFPIKTHAVVVDMPAPGSDVGRGWLDSIHPALLAGGAALAALLLPIFLTRGVAMFCGRDSVQT